MRRAIVLLAMMGVRLAGQPASIAGTVVDQTSGKPVERVHVSLTSPETSDAYGAMSDSAGHFSIARVSPGKYQLRAERTGYVHLADNNSVSLKAGQQLTDFQVKMARASMLIGRVVDQYGDPVQRLDARNGSGGDPVTLLVSANWGEISGTVSDSNGPVANAVAVLGGNTFVHTDSSGHYSFSSLRPGTYKLLAGGEELDEDLEEFEDAIVTVEVHAGDKITQDLEMTTPGKL